MNAQAQKLRVLELQAQVAGFPRLLGETDAPAISRRHARWMPELPASLLDGNGRAISSGDAARARLNERPVQGDAFQARDGQASPRALLRGLGHAVPIAIAMWVAIYFAAQLIRGALS